MPVLQFATNVEPVIFTVVFVKSPINVALPAPKGTRVTVELNVKFFVFVLLKSKSPTDKLNPFVENNPLCIYKLLISELA